MSIQIQVLGPGCARCEQLLANAKAAATLAGMECTFEKVSDLQKIASFSVMTTPALVVNGEVKLSGETSTPQAIAQLLKDTVPCCTTEERAVCCPATPAPAACCTDAQGSSCCGGGAGKSSRTGIILFALIVAVLAVLLLKKGPCCTAPEPSATKQAQPAPAASITRPLPRLVDLGSTTCRPCKVMDGILGELRQAYPKTLAVEFINVNLEKEKTAAYKIRVIPTQIWLDAQGKELFRHEGVIGREAIAEKFKEFGVDLGAPEKVSPAVNATELPEGAACN